MDAVKKMDNFLVELFKKKKKEISNDKSFEKGLR